MSALIALEGISGVGKTTHSKLLVDWIEEKNLPTIKIAEPSNTKFGSKLKKNIVKYKEQKEEELVKLECLLFANDRFIQYLNTTKPALKKGKFIVSDRSVYSSYAYQQARGLEIDVIKELNQFNPNPDLVLILDATIETSLKRLEKTTKTDFDAIFDKTEILKKARENYLKMAKKEEEGKIELVDTENTIEETQKEIRKHVKKIL